MGLAGADVSVCVPAFEDPVRLVPALESIAAQTVLPGEVVVSDDGSTADVAGAVERFAAAHPALAVTFLRSPVTTGVVQNRNRAIAATSGAWIAMLDHDDVWLPTKLEQQLAFLRGWDGARPLVAVATWGTNVNDALVPMSAAPMGGTTEADYEATLARADLFYLLHSSLLIRAADLRAVGGYDDAYGNSNDDVWLMSRLAQRGAIVSVPEPLVLYRKTVSSGQIQWFAEQQAEQERLLLNLGRARRSEPPLTRAERAAQLAAEPLVVRVRRRLLVFGKHQYRLGAAMACNGQCVRGGARLLLAAVFDPTRTRDGLRSALRTRRR